MFWSAVSSKNTRKRCEICLETLDKGVKYVPVETLEKDVKYIQSSGVFIINFEHISDLFLVCLLFTVSIQISVRDFFFV